MRPETLLARTCPALVRPALVGATMTAALTRSVVLADDACAPGGVTNILACAASDAASAATQSLTQSAVQAVTQCVVDAAVWLLNKLVGVIFSSSSPSLSADWFHAHYAGMVAVAWATAPIFLLLGVVQALIGPEPARTFGRMLAQLVVVAILS